MGNGTSDQTKRMNYFDRQFLRARDFQEEQSYHMDRQRRHGRLLHTPGIAGGLEVSGNEGSTRVEVQPGTALDLYGREIVLAQSQTLSLEPHKGETKVYIYVLYHEEPSDPSADPGINGFMRSWENPALVVLGTGDAVSEDALLLAAVPLDPDTGQIDGPISDAGRVYASSRLGNKTVTEPMLADKAVSSRALAPEAVGEAKIADDAVSASKLRDADDRGDAVRAVTADHIRNLNVTAPKLADKAVSTRSIADGAVIEGKLADNSVVAAKLKAADETNDAVRAVTTNHVRNRNITEAKLADSAVSARVLADGSVTEAKLATGAVSARALLDRAAGRGKIGLAAVSLDELGGKMVEGTVEIPANGSAVIPPSPLKPGFFLVNIYPADAEGAIFWQEGCGRIGPSAGRVWQVTNPGAKPVKVAYQVFRLNES